MRCLVRSPLEISTPASAYVMDGFLLGTDFFWGSGKGVLYVGFQAGVNPKG